MRRRRLSVCLFVRLSVVREICQVIRYVAASGGFTYRLRYTCSTRDQSVIVQRLPQLAALHVRLKPIKYGYSGCLATSSRQEGGGGILGQERYNPTNVGHAAIFVETWFNNESL